MLFWRESKMRKEIKKDKKSPVRMSDPIQSDHVSPFSIVIPGISIVGNWML